ncbi:hypothetical protein CEXT_40571 [Caerostris extrusa]|uniref:Uncharacterized protein n=1 Tax=Caerostris extrusa TaxID=172846 RepID=A0AAV4QGK1_CAEEX|nr:hypothetical protein CEXT_40571 [Caerostris extrusa]
MIRDSLDGGGGGGNVFVLDCSAFLNKEAPINLIRMMGIDPNSYAAFSGAYAADTMDSMSSCAHFPLIHGPLSIDLLFTYLSAFYLSGPLWGR